MKLALFSLFALSLVGCDRALTVNLPARQSIVNSEPQTSVTATGTIVGQVRWSGELPNFEPIAVFDPTSRSLPNPRNASIGKDRSVAGAVVYLRNVPATEKSWPHAAVSVEVNADGLHFRESARKSNTAFVRVGDSIAIRSALDGITGVRGRGADFFTFMLPKLSDETRRVCSQPGRVELTSASGQFWSCLELFVCEHPFYATTDANGGFTFTDVPVGEYEIVCWHPNWRFVGHERNPESGIIVRKKYAPAVEKRTKVAVEVRQSAKVGFALQATDFLTPVKP